MNLLQRLRLLWWARQRAIDLQILWPVCKEQARDLDHAKAAFAVHAFQDACWIEALGEQRLIEVIGELK